MLIYRYIHRVRGDTVCHYNESTWSSLHSGRYIEMRERGDTAGSYRHGDVVVAGRDVGRQRPKRIKWRLGAPFQLFLHVLFDEVHGNVARPFIHDLTTMFPRDLVEFALSFQHRKLRFIVRIRNPTRPQSVAETETHVVRRHVLAN